MTLFNGKINASKDFQGNIIIEHDLLITNEKLCAMRKIQEWNAAINMLIIMIKLDPETKLLINNRDPQGGVKTMLEHRIAKALKALVELYSHDETAFKAFEIEAQSGEFNFGSNCYGSVDLNDGTVDFDSHGLENFQYKSLRDFYVHYVLNKPVPYKYCALIGHFNEETKQIDFLEEKDAERLKGVDIDIDGNDIFSDLVEVNDNKGYSQRSGNKIIINGIVL